MNIRMLITDCDGTLTTGKFLYNCDGVSDSISTDTKDMHGFTLLKEAGIKSAIITGTEPRFSLEQRVIHSDITFLYEGIENKLECIKELCADLGITLEETAYIGDDLNDKDCLINCGIKACPADAIDDLKLIPGIIVLKHNGGNGAIRELVSYILKENFNVKS
jgi:N-acylneuraminate cytidylyltransferase